MKYTGKKEDITYISDIKHTNEQTEKAGAVSIAVRIIGLILAARTSPEQATASRPTK